VPLARTAHSIEYLTRAVHLVMFITPVWKTTTWRSAYSLSNRRLTSTRLTYRYFKLNAQHSLLDFQAKAYVKSLLEDKQLTLERARAEVTRATKAALQLEHSKHVREIQSAKDQFKQDRERLLAEIEEKNTEIEKVCRHTYIHTDIHT
jgi:hypothetical protein